MIQSMLYNLFYFKIYPGLCSTLDVCYYPYVPVSYTIVPLEQTSIHPIFHRNNLENRPAENPATIRNDGWAPFWPTSVSLSGMADDLHCELQRRRACANRHSAPPPRICPRRGAPPPPAGCTYAHMHRMTHVPRSTFARCTLSHYRWKSRAGPRVRVCVLVEMCMAHLGPRARSAHARLHLRIGYDIGRNLARFYPRQTF